MASKSFVFRFDDVEVREGEFSLTKAGKVLAVEPKAFRALLVLLRNPQKVITKEELLNAVWGGTAVADGSLTRCIWLLRRVLGDDINQPRYIETVATVGYRFVCPVEATIGPEAVTDTRIPSPEPEVRNSAAPTDFTEPDVSRRFPKPRRRRLGFAITAMGIVIAGAGLLMAWWWIRPAVPVVESIVQLTEDRQAKLNLATDGVRIYFNDGWGVSGGISQISVTGGPPVAVESGIPFPSVAAVKRDGSALLVVDLTRWQFDLAWVQLPTGEVRTLGHIYSPADLFPDGRLVHVSGPQEADILPDRRPVDVSHQQEDVLITDQQGSNPRQLVSLPRPIRSVAVSPDGRRVLFSMVAEGSHYAQFDELEISADGSDLRTIRKSSADECCFRWSWDGKYVIYSARTRRRWDLWAIQVHGGLLRQSREPIQLTNGPLSYPQGAIPSPDGKQLFSVGVKERGELVRYDVKSQKFVPLLRGISATDATFSVDGKWAAYISYPDHILWRSRSDGTERMQLTYPPMEVQEPFISPDGRKVVFGTPSSGTFIVDMDGGLPKQVGEKIGGPRWSPDGNSIVVNTVTPEGDIGQIRVIDVRTGKSFDLPFEEGAGFAGPCWLDQDTILADTLGNAGLATFSLKTGKWTGFYTIYHVNQINAPDGKYVYVATGGADPGIVRIRVADRHLETIASLKEFVRVMNYGWTQLRVAPDGSPTLTRALDGPEIYTLNVRWP